MGSKEGNYIERYWRDATPQDAIAEPPMVARFRDEHYQDWFVDKLIYWDRSEVPWHRDDGFWYCCCQVYDAPDPGEGWRLIDVEKESHECEKQHWHPGQKRWIDAGLSDEFYGDLIYRRRIEQPKSEPKYVPFTWEDREQLRGRWVADVDGYEFLLVTLEWRSSGVIEMNGVDADSALEMWTFLDTGEPVGKRVD